MPTTINPSSQTITQHAVQVGAANNLLTQLIPGAAGTVVTSNGPSADPSYQAVSSYFLTINYQTFTSSGTYTPSAGMQYAIARGVGGGGGGAGATYPGTNPMSGGVGGGGAAGAYSEKILTPALVGASKPVTIGTGGTGATGNSSGGAGGATSIGSLLVAAGGSGGHPITGYLGVTTVSAAKGGLASSSVGDITISGSDGGIGAVANVWGVYSGSGGGSLLGSQNNGVIAQQINANGLSGNNYGSGGTGAIRTSTAGNSTGGNGSPGIIIITEYIS